MFIIELKREKADEKLSFRRVMRKAEAFHEDCARGRAPLIRYDADNWLLICRRCGAETSLYTAFSDSHENKNTVRIEILKTAIDGEERKIGENIKIVQKTETK